MKNINQLKDAFDMAGQKVQDLEDERAQFAIDLGKDENSHSVDDIKKLNASLKNAKMAQELAKSAYEDARANLNAEPINKKPLPVKDGKPDAQAMKNQFVKDFKNLVTSGTTGAGNAGLTIPEDIQLQIRTLTRSFASFNLLKMLYPDWLVMKLDVLSIAGSRVLFSKSLISSNLEIVGFLGALPITSRILALRVTTSFLAAQLTNH